MIISGSLTRAGMSAGGHWSFPNLPTKLSAL